MGAPEVLGRDEGEVPPGDPVDGGAPTGLLRARERRFAREVRSMDQFLARPWRDKETERGAGESVHVREAPPSSLVQQLGGAGADGTGEDPDDAAGPEACGGIMGDGPDYPGVADLSKVRGAVLRVGGPAVAMGPERAWSPPTHSGRVARGPYQRRELSRTEWEGNPRVPREPTQPPGSFVARRKGLLQAAN